MKPETIHFKLKKGIAKLRLPKYRVKISAAIEYFKV